MGLNSMRIDVLPHRKILIGGIIAAVFVIIGLIVGATGPKSILKERVTAYQCPNGAHIWSNECTGVEMRLGEESSVTLQYDKLSTLNRFISIYATPIPRRLTAQITERKFLLSFTASIDIKGSNSQSGWKVLHRNTATINVECEYGEKPADDICENFMVTVDDNIEFSKYQITAYFTVFTDRDSSRLGDVVFDKYKGNPPYGNLELTLNIIFVLNSAGVIISWMYGLYRCSFKSWTVEQKLTLALTITLLVYNNPMLSFKYIVGVEWFFNFCDSIFKDVFVSYLLIYWLILIHRAIKEDIKNLKHDLIPKFVAVSAFFILISVMHFIVNITLKSDPTLNTNGATKPATILLVFAAVIFTAIVVWLCVTTFLSFPTISSSDFIRTRFLFIAIPSSIVMISQLGDLFSGNFISLTKTSFQLAFNYFLFNTFVWVMVIGYWPVSSYLVPSAPGETEEQTSIISKPKNPDSSINDDDDEYEERKPFFFSSEQKKEEI